MTGYIDRDDLLHAVEMSRQNNPHKPGAAKIAHEAEKLNIGI